MKIVKKAPSTPDIKTEPMSPSQPVYFVAPNPQGSDPESECEMDTDSTSDYEPEIDVDLNVSDYYDACLDDCAPDCTIPPPCLMGKPYIKAENLCRHCGERFQSEVQRQLHEISHLRTCDCGHFQYKTFEELHAHLPYCYKMPTFRCGWSEYGCPAQFRDIRSLFHHTAVCLYEMNAPVNRQITNATTRRRRLF